MLVGDQRGGGNDAEEIGLEDCSLLLNDHLDVKHFWGAFETYFGRLLGEQCSLLLNDHLHLNFRCETFWGAFETYLGSFLKYIWEAFKTYLDWIGLGSCSF